MAHICSNARLLFFFLCVSYSPFTLGQVSVPAVVLDGSGQSIHGLQKSDFVVTFSKGATFGSVQEVPPVRLNGFADPIPVFILYDAISMAPVGQGQVSDLLLDYLRQAAQEHRAVTVLENTGRGIVVIHDLSTDSKVLSAALDRIAKHPTPTDATSGMDPTLRRRSTQRLLN